MKQSTRLVGATPPPPPRTQSFPVVTGFPICKWLESLHCSHPQSEHAVMLPFRGWGNWGSGSCSFCVPELALWIPISVLCLLPASAAVSRHGNLWALPCSVPPSFQSKGPQEVSGPTSTGEEARDQVLRRQGWPLKEIGAPELALPQISRVIFQGRV